MSALDLLAAYGRKVIAWAAIVGGLAYLGFAATSHDGIQPIHGAIAIALVAVGVVLILPGKWLRIYRSTAGQSLDDQLLDLDLAFAHGRISEQERERLRKRILQRAFDE